MPRNKRPEFDEDEFFGFAKSYLSEAFPNPHRIDCPPDFHLQRMAEVPVPERDDEISKHLTCCMLQSLHGNPGGPEAQESRIVRAVSAETKIRSVCRLSNHRDLLLTKCCVGVQSCCTAGREPGCNSSNRKEN
jgi:hypothetical protein